MSNDPLLDKIARATSASAAAQFQREKAAAGNTWARFGRDLWLLGVFWSYFGEGLGWIYAWMIRPITSRLWRLARWLFEKYRRFFLWAITKTDAYGNTYRSVPRSGGLILSTIFAIFLLFSIAHLTWTAALYLATVQHDDHINLTFSQEIYPELDIHSVKGCEQIPCTDSNSLYFRVGPSLFNWIWWAVHRHQWFLPDQVAGTVPPGNNKCIATTYGVRWRITIFLGVNAYPEILDIKRCEPVVGPTPASKEIRK